MFGAYWAVQGARSACVNYHIQTPTTGHDYEVDWHVGETVRVEYASVFVSLATEPDVPFRSELNASCNLTFYLERKGILFGYHTLGPIHEKSVWHHLPCEFHQAGNFTWTIQKNLSRFDLDHTTFRILVMDTSRDTPMPVGKSFDFRLKSPTLSGKFYIRNNHPKFTC